MRAFVAVDLPGPACDLLERLQDDLPVGRLMAPETFHLTLAFLGEAPETAIGEVHEGLTKLRANPFSVRLRGVDVFGGRQPKLIWAGVAHQPALTALREKVRRAISGSGLDLPRERFRPHVTLARLGKHMRDDEAAKLRGFLAHHAGFSSKPFAVRRFNLYRSILHRDGAQHEMLAEYLLE